MDFLINVALLPLSAVAMLMVFGLLGAPFAALICVIIARVKGLGQSYAGTGACP